VTCCHALIMHFAAIMHFPEVHDRREVHDQRLRSRTMTDVMPAS